MRNLGITETKISFHSIISHYSLFQLPESLFLIFSEFETEHN